MDVELSIPADIQQRAALITTIRRKLQITKTTTLPHGQIVVLEWTAWSQGNLEPDDLMCRGYCAELVSQDPLIHCLTQLSFSKEEALRWARVLFPEGGVIPPPAFPKPRTVAHV